MTKTTFATLADHAAAMDSWYVVDARRKILGRMASDIAEVLMGKRKPLYTPHINVGDGVIVINAAKVAVEGNSKRQKKIYRNYSGYPGGLRETPLGEMMDKDPVHLVKTVVRRMLPKNRIGRAMLARLKVYAGADHPHAAQKPKELRLEA